MASSGEEFEMKNDTQVLTSSQKTIMLVDTQDRSNEAKVSKCPTLRAPHRKLASETLAALSQTLEETT